MLSPPCCQVIGANRSIADKIYKCPNFSIFISLSVMYFSWTETSTTTFTTVWVSFVSVSVVHFSLTISVIVWTLACPFLVLLRYLQGNIREHICLCLNRCRFILLSNRSELRHPATAYSSLQFGWYKTFTLRYGVRDSLSLELDPSYKSCQSSVSACI